MLKVVSLGLLLTIGLADHNPQSVIIGDEVECDWRDFEDCDHDEWEFDNPDPRIHSIHRDAREDLVDYCHYGEWGSENVNAMTYLNVFADIEDNYMGNSKSNVMGIGFRIWAFCDWALDERVQVWLFDQFNGDVTSADEKLSLSNYNRGREIFLRGKRDNSCSNNNALFHWSFEATSDSPDWLNEVPCVNGQANCYDDYYEVWDITGPALGLFFTTTIASPIDTAAWAYSNLHVNACGPEAPPCCTGTHSKGKNCEDLHEVRNCEAKGCKWSRDDICMRDCCRKVDPATKVKGDTSPKCKNTNYLLPDICNQRDDCLISDCDLVGQQDGILNLRRP